MRQVPRPLAHPRFPETQHLCPEQIVALSPEKGAVRHIVLFVPGSDSRLRLEQRYQQIARDPIRALVRLVLKRHPRSPGKPSLDF